MYFLLIDKECQKPEKYSKLDSTPEKNGRCGRGEQKFENGCIYKGNFLDDMFHGNGEFVFPEGTLLSGQFEQNHFRKGTISLSVGIKLGCVTETDYETLEDFFKEFQVVLGPETFLKGSTNNRGHLETAKVVSRGQTVSSFAGTNLVFKMPGDNKQFLIVSRLWFYIGDMMNFSGENHTGPIFDGKGSQIWYSGIGYNQGSRVQGQLHGEQNMLRHCSGLQFFRSMSYAAGKLENSVTVFNNGLIFTTDEDYFKGHLRLILASGESVEFECSLNDYSSLKQGVLKARHDDSEIRMSEKSGLLMFHFKGKDVTLEEFKHLIS